MMVNAVPTANNAAETMRMVRVVRRVRWPRMGRWRLRELFQLFFIVLVFVVVRIGGHTFSGEALYASCSVLVRTAARRSLQKTVRWKGGIGLF
jgi:hypothetical protein